MDATVSPFVSDQHSHSAMTPVSFEARCYVPFSFLTDCADQEQKGWRVTWKPLSLLLLLKGGARQKQKGLRVSVERATVPPLLQSGPVKHRRGGESSERAH